MQIFCFIILIGILYYIKILIENKGSKKEKNNINIESKYIKKEYLLTQTELKFYKVLKIITDELNLVICPQVSLYEIIKNNDYKDFNRIAKKNIDFVITEPNLKIKLCIELDDYTHNQQKRIERDNFVNEILKNADVKILRITVQNYYNLEELKKKIKESL